MKQSSPSTALSDLVLRDMDKTNSRLPGNIIMQWKMRATRTAVQHKSRFEGSIAGCASDANSSHVLEYWRSDKRPSAWY